MPDKIGAERARDSNDTLRLKPSMIAEHAERVRMRAGAAPWKQKRRDVLVSLSTASSVRVASIVGTVNIGNVQKVRESVERAGARQSRLIVSFEECTACDCSSISVLLDIYRRFGDKLAVIAPKRSPFRHILGVTATANVLPVVETVDAAVRRLQGGLWGDGLPLC